MDLEDAITITKIDLQDERCHLMVGWQPDSFEMYLYTKEKLWKGKFSSTRLAGFSNNLHMSKDTYLNTVRKCLSQRNDNYHYELKSGFFYWKKKIKDSFVIEGFLPMEIDKSPKNCQPDVIDILLALNKYLKDKIYDVKYKFHTIKSDYQKCLMDTEEFLNLKIEMEKALCDKFLNLISIKKSKVETLEESEKIDCNDI
ncbi:hypothetical protein O3G_MSEX014233 [Manduca sexta]|uniref:XRCC4 N-terminal domain-containing protein n=1 Tax=Manduca sexta TaxID=7130 RepID=A0A922CZR8_MANSE|nr:hypothetical protein O3G_MSEX014233 [Manduca sexta]